MTKPSGKPVLSGWTGTLLQLVTKRAEELGTEKSDIDLLQLAAEVSIIIEKRLKP